MKKNRLHERIERLKADIESGWIYLQARLEGDETSWTRKRKMPLSDMLRSVLGRKGLTTRMELRQYFQALVAWEREVTKQDYLKRRKKVNWEVFREFAY
jgi:glutathione S-transferase